MPFLAQNQDLTLRLLAVLCDKLRRTSMALEEIALFDLAGPPCTRAAEAGGGLRPAECHRHPHRPEAVTARPQQPRRRIARERQQAVAGVAREIGTGRTIWRTASSCCAGRAGADAHLTDVRETDATSATSSSTDGH